ncbi:aspartate carbamoyltransferase catalytic subunit [Pediococcus acidilactici]|uniref:aspartate carbamoyltransferase catalytic subunit n=1 Tax=Pediococcus acidilactici TaxID=1254 RepID=UPI0003271F0C|nr:aspartate carbamoyltransferase catalytic subunit [Pediococcus acidilactici]EOA07809.1 aspartate carbamoyltransferase, pyrB [Pediococcus acidilactici D3]MBW9307167.1 aspartate carbamoyltransferase catalytic subunit [Pediococcus acidilactici]MDB8857928.1 aspartate carbamoyltransferase catalytic subunit [Pediococcus acidilactici]MDL2055909.1 aspartate carbamoyltransferase catalytic subunit [Pediococcus acidilactici]MDQ7763397.1 aspartate carbamoyltransferase catalytic subunit [Pediococcus acid
MNMHDLTTVENFNEADVLHKIKLAEEFKKGKKVQLKRPVYAMNLFFENSTRTHTSFEMAEQRLGMKMLEFEAQTSSVSKGETLLDTVKTIDAIRTDVAVIRHPQNDYYEPILDENLDISIVNAGDGSGQHPSQSLLDIMTIYEEFGRFAGLKVAITGDIAHSRVARSNAMLLNKLGAQVYFAGPEEWMAEDLADYGTYRPIDELVDQVDVMMLLRIQKERIQDRDNLRMEVQDYLTNYGLTKQRAERMQPHAIIMHPAPVNRGIEIESKLVECQRSRIFKQMTNGMYMRMAILTDVLNAKNLVMGA